LGQQNLMLALSAVLFPIQLLNSLFVSILSSHRYFTVPMLVSLVNSLVSITVLVLLGTVFSITGAVIAVIAGYVVNFVWLIFFMRKHLHWNFFEKPVRPAGKVFHNIFLMQINLLPISLRSYITTLLLSGLGAGVITALNYGQQISFIPEMLILTQVIAVVGIKFNELSAKGAQKDLNLVFSDLLSLLFLIILPVAAVLAIMSEEVVREIFGRSNKISRETMDNIAMIIYFMALTLPARSLDMVMTKLITAQQKIKEGVIYGIITHVIVTLFIFIGLKFYGLKGYLAAFFIGNVILLPLLYFLLIKKMAPFIDFTKWLIRSAPFILFNILLIIGFIQLKKYFLLEMHPLLSISLVSAGYFSAVVIFNYLSGYYEPVNSIIRKTILRK